MRTRPHSALHRRKCAPNGEQRWKCRCGKHWTEDDPKFWLACDTCDRWFHGECVGVSEAKVVSWGQKRKWNCTSCTAAERRRKTVATRCERYCICRGYWDGRSFMIMCDGCNVWYHGAW